MPAHRRRHASAVAWLLCLVVALLAPSAQGSLPQSPKELQERITTVFSRSAPCVRLLHSRGASGCSGKADRLPIRRYVADGDGTPSDESIVLLVEEAQIAEVLDELAGSGAGGKHLRGIGAVGGVLVATGGDASHDRPSSFSPVGVFPDKSLAPYNDVDYAWNPHGLDIITGANRTEFPPMFLLTADESKKARAMADWNADQGTGRFPMYVANLDTTMNAARDRNSFECLQSKTCLPIGGFSVLAGLPSQPTQASPPDGCILVVAQIDSSNLFHDVNKGAERSLSSLIAGMAAFEAVAKGLRASGAAAKRRIAFAMLTSEGWGLAGSRRLVHELEKGGSIPGEGAGGEGCRLEDLRYVLEIGQVGKSKASTYYAHTTGESDPMQATVWDAIQKAAQSLNSVTVERAKGTPGIPPSSLMSFQQREAPVEGMVIADFEREYANAYAASYLDNGANIDLSSVVRASELVAKTVYTLATSDAMAGMNASDVNATVFGLSACLLSADPGMQCPMVQQGLDSTLGDVSLYSSVLAFGQKNPNKNLQATSGKSDVELFVWNFLATRSDGLADLAELDGAAGCDFPTGKLKCARAGSVCARWRAHSHKGPNGRCVNASSVYMPAWSHFLAFTNGSWGVLPGADASKDAIWTESFWNYGYPYAYAYLTMSSLYDSMLFCTSAFLLALWWLTLRAINLSLNRKLKDM